MEKHFLSFEEGATVFRDFEALSLDDPDIFEDEVRFALLGYSTERRLLVVERGVRIRIVSVQSATKSERDFMKKKGKAEDGEIRAEYDFSTARKNPYAERANQNTNIVVIDPDLYEVFPSGEAVNEALRLNVKVSAKALKKASKIAKAS